jgi:hypothetical protein
MLQITTDCKTAVRPRKPATPRLARLLRRRHRQTPRNKRECAKLAAQLVMNRLVLTELTVTLASMITVFLSCSCQEIKKLKAAHPGDDRLCSGALGRSRGGRRQADPQAD